MIVWVRRETTGRYTVLEPKYPHDPMRDMGQNTVLVELSNEEWQRISAVLIAEKNLQAELKHMSTYVERPDSPPTKPDNLVS